MTTPARIEVDHVSKRYVKYDDAPLLLSRAVQWRQRTKRSSLWALQDVDFNVPPGECLGIIGHNGSGKSTLLRLLAGVTGPSRGRVKVRGRIAPLIAVGVGFHQELSGRENVHANGTILGLSRAEIDRRLPDIVDFAEIDDFIDTPVKFYSTGMYMRLGFAVSVIAEPDVLLVDEVLSVGDLAFQAKCLERMMEIRRAGTTIVIVSHNLGAIRRMCDRTIVLHAGRVRHDGDTVDGISKFHELLRSRSDMEELGDFASETSIADDPGQVESVALISPSGEPTRQVHSQDDVRMRMTVRFTKPAVNAVVGMRIWDEFALLYMDFSPLETSQNFASGDVVEIEARFRPNLRSGSYLAQMALMQDNGVVAARTIPLDFFVDSPPRVEGVVDLDAKFSVDGSRLSSPPAGALVGDTHGI